MQSGGWAIYIVVSCRVQWARDLHSLGVCRYIIFFQYAEELNIEVLYSYLVSS
jgi:hypothetical protein